MTGKVMSQVHLFQGKTVLVDDRKLRDYSLTEGATISSLFEPDVDITIEVSIGHKTQKLTVPNSTSVMALKVQISGVMRCGVAPEKLEIRLGDVMLEDPMPLHFYRIKNGSKLDAIKPYVEATIQNNHGATLYWRLERKDTIKEVKLELAAAQSSSPMRFYFYLPKSYQPNITTRAHVSSCNEIRGYQGAGMIPKSMKLYFEVDGKFDELDDHKTVENYKIKDGDNLFLLTYTWTLNEGDVKVMKTGRKVHGAELEDTCLGIKLRAQDQVGLPVKDIRLFYMQQGTCTLIMDEERPLRHGRAPLVVATEEEFQAEVTRVEEEKIAEKARKLEERKEAKRQREQSALVSQPKQRYWKAIQYHTVK